MVGERIQRARKAKDLSLRALGDLVEVSQTTILKYEKNQSVPNSTMLLKIAKAVGVKTEYFFRTKEIKLEKVEYRKREMSNIKLQVIESKIHDLI
jgi:transcriptional regulator with XRE-family HTH domain